MEELKFLVVRAQNGDGDAYEKIVQRFQDMAVGYSYVSLGELQGAKDAAQEAFIKAYYTLASLHDPAAFPGWFRRIVLQQIDRIRRGKQLPMIPLEWAVELTSSEPSPVEIIEEREVYDMIFEAITTLPETQREVVFLFYISAYSQNEISAFLEVPVSTVRMRLYTARKQLKEKLLLRLQDKLPEVRPSKDEKFTKEISMKLNLAMVMACTETGCWVQFLKSSVPVETRYSLPVQKYNIKIRPGQLVIVDKGTEPPEIIYRWSRGVVTELINDQVRLEENGQSVLAKYDKALEGEIKIGEEVFFLGFNADNWKVVDLVTNGQPAHPERLSEAMFPQMLDIEARAKE